MDTLKIANYIVAVVFAICYSYQFIYVPIVLFFKKRAEKKHETALKKTKENRFAFLICARNEEVVIGDLIDSINTQDYPKDKLKVFVMADNCTDSTDKIAKMKGAEVYYRNDMSKIGKGYALDALLKHIMEDYPEGFDGYFVFDADNILTGNYVSEMNKTFCEGYNVITSYRNTKNYGSNWISAGYGLWFLRESRYLNNARDIIGASCAVSGTGFMFSDSIAKELNGWPFHMLTEDIEFSMWQITSGHKIGFNPNAEFFDEQPICLKQSFKQRMRWAKGYIQVIKGYGKKMFLGILHGSFSCFDMTMNIMPAFILTCTSIILNIVLGFLGASVGDNPLIALMSIGQSLGNMYLMLFGLGLITVITEWERIRTTKAKKILSVFTFPFFMFTYIPIAVIALFKRTEWEPIAHTMSINKLPSPILRHNT